MSIDLEQVVLDGGTRFVNFFEGRILTGRDLREEQTAGRDGRGALGRAIGWGVLHGLEVTDATPSGAGATPTVRVAAGRAVNREGQTLTLSTDRSVRLAELATTGPPDPSANVFGLCADQPAASAAPTAEGFHILTVAPATGYEEEAPKSGLGDGGTAAGCGRRYVTLGLRFRLVRFDPALLAGPDAGAEIAELAAASGDAALSRLRNRVAHLGLGTTARAGFAQDPFARTTDGASTWAGWGLEAGLGRGPDPTLMACELPLAVLRLRGGAIAYIDMWSVRRGLRRPPAASDWPLIAASARQEADRATLFQFQDQLAWLFKRASNPSATTAAAHFSHLPPVGFLPLASPSPFLPEVHPPLPLDPGRVIPLVEEALAYPAVDLANEPVFATYRVAGTDWTLFVSDAVPSAERKAARCAEMEDRIRILEETLAAPGRVTGTVTYDLRMRGTGGTSGGSIDPTTGNIAGMRTSGSEFLIALAVHPFPDLTVRATPAGGDTAIDATTGRDGGYTLTLPPGVYDIALIYKGIAFSNQRVEAVEVQSGAITTLDFVLTSADIAEMEAQL